MINLKMKSYEGGTLKGNWLATIKLDGVCVLLDCPNRTAMSKRGKPLNNFEYMFDIFPEVKGTFEVFRKNWETTVSLVRTQDSEDKVYQNDLYPLDTVREWMCLTQVSNPSEEVLRTLLREVVNRGNEGLVMVPIKDGKVDWTGKRVKVKPSITVDVRVTGIQPGTGKHTGKMGALMTKYGKVGTGFTDEDRDALYIHEIIGQIIEVEIMEWTKDGKMRHPRFKRLRFDKTEENIELFKGYKE